MRMQKKNFEEPILELVIFASADILATSGDGEPIELPSIPI